MDDLQRQCDAYFQKEGFHRLFEGLRDKYRSLGHLGGTILLSSLSEIEKKALNGLLRIDLANKKEIRITVAKLEKILLDTKFATIPLEDIVARYFHEPLMSKKQQNEQYITLRDAYFQSILEEKTDNYGGKWLREVLQQKSGIYQTLMQRYEGDKKRLRVQLSHVLSALDQLPVYEHKRLRLPVFASSITQDPHSFDEQKDEIGMLLHGICTILKLSYHTGMNAEERMEILYAAGIQKDDISNFTTIYRMYAFQDNNEIFGWREFAKCQQPLQVSLMNLNDVTSITTEQHVYVVENPSVFSALVEFCHEHQRTDISLMCTYGQLRIASLQVLDYLAAAHLKFQYAGDFDPEGLQIAQMLLQRYPQSCTLWRYAKKDYHKARSMKLVNSERAKKLVIIQDIGLLEMKDCLLRDKRCAYQEQLIDDYCRDLEELS